MSRYNPHHDVAPVLDAAQQWIQQCLIDEGSLFTDRKLWTHHIAEEVRSAFVDHPDASNASFYDKLERQLEPASLDAKRLAAEMLWALLLFQSNIGAEKKRESIKLVWKWSGEKLDQEHALLSDAVLAGIGNPGTAYNTGRWREFGYLITLALTLTKQSREERQELFSDRERFEQWLAQAPQEGYRQFRHILRYFAFPDRNERITQNRDRRRILEAFTDIEPQRIKAMSDAEQDDALLELRGRLRDELDRDELDFYASPLKERWKDSVGVREPSAKVELPFIKGFAELRKRFLDTYPGFDAFPQYAPYIEGERNYKDELLALFSNTVKPAIEAEDWETAGDQAIALLTHPLKEEGNRPQNIVGWRNVGLIRQWNDAQKEAFGRSLAELFDEHRPITERVDAFVDAMNATMEDGEHLPPAAQRSFTGFYLTLWDPERYLFFKTREMQRAFQLLDPNFKWTPSGLTGTDVAKVNSIAHDLFEALEAEGWAPKDLVDVQGFMWVAMTHDRASGDDVDEESEEYMGQNSSQVSPVNPAPLNQIFFGPPGSGKTFATVGEAVRILDPACFTACESGNNREALKKRFDELVNAKRIRFVTFHQSFSYEDFVEGLRADHGEEGQLQYRIEPGVFKSICDAARGSAQVASEVGIREDARIWKLSIDGTGPSSTRDYCFAHDEARIGWGEVGDLRGEDLIDRPAYQALGSNDRNTLQAFSAEMQPGDIVLCIGSATTVQAIGVVQEEYEFQSSTPPGVRKDYGNVFPVRWLATGFKLDLQSLNGGVRFTLKTIYEISRFNWSELSSVLESNGITLKGAKPVHDQKPIDHVLIIDEINRGNIARIFGELITLIEPSKRAGAEENLRVTLPYSKKLFDVPKSVYLIGTMNTADRSLAGLDIALRRRFQFIEMPADPEKLQGVDVEGVSLKALLQAMNDRIEALLDRDHQLGHTYFMGLSRSSSLDDLATVFKNNILPLLQEYFFEDWERIHWVLNDHRKPKDFQFVVSNGVKKEDLFGPEVQLPVSAAQWKLNPKAFEHKESYLGIYLAQND